MESHSCLEIGFVRFVRHQAIEGKVVMVTGFENPTGTQVRVLRVRVRVRN